MKINKKFLSCITAAALLGTAACGDDEDPDPTPPATGFPQPAGTVAVNFSIDASDRKDFYEDAGLEWKGNFIYDAATRVITGPDSSWPGPYAPLYDDGPWDQGGHEPKGSVKGDDKFGITVFFKPAAEAVKFEYGAQIPKGPNCSNDSGCWIWTGSNGTVTVPANATTEVRAEGMKLTPEGAYDLKLTLNTNTLGSGHALEAGEQVLVKGTFSDWSTEPAYDDGTHGDATAGDKIFTYTLSQSSIRRLKLAAGTNAEFIWKISANTTDNSGEYKTSAGAGETTGVKAFVKGATGDFVERPVAVTTDSNKNTYVVIQTQ